MKHERAPTRDSLQILSLPPSSGVLERVSYSSPDPWKAPGGGFCVRHWLLRAVRHPQGWVMQVEGWSVPTIGGVPTRVGLSSEPVATRSESLSSELSIFLTIRAINSPIFIPEGEVP